jgi:SAM-dependent methyltransferase
MDELSPDPDEATHQLAAARSGEPTAWFDDLYRAAGDGRAEVPWDRPTPNPLLVEWVERAGLPTSARTIVVGAGYGRDAQFLAGLGYPTTAFDISPSAVEQTRRRHPDSPVDYRVADLLALPDAWRGGFDLVVESMNVQALPEPPRADAIRSVAELVAAGGTLVVIVFGADGGAAERDARPGPPWPLVRSEIDSFAVDGLDLVAVERVYPDEDLRWRATLRRR